MEKRVFDVGGMSCAACAARIERAVGKLDGVGEVCVNLIASNMGVSFDAAKVGPKEIEAAVRNAGYSVSLREKNGIPADSDLKFARELGAIKTRLCVSAVFALPVMYLSMAMMAGLPLPNFFMGGEGLLRLAFCQMLLSVPVIVVNAGYFRSGFLALAKFRADMNSLVSLGSGAAFIFGAYTLCMAVFDAGGNSAAENERLSSGIYFDSAAMILTLVTLGRFLEARVKRKTGAAITALMGMSAKSARVLRGGEEFEIPIDEVRVADVLIVKSGERIPVDGVVLEGRGVLDESVLTGESMPVEKNPGDFVSAATVNAGGYFRMEALRVGEDTTFARIIKIVENASASKAPIARLADKISGVFVPFVIVVALASAIIWLALGYDFGFALSIGISVLVVSCPCALGLATPTAITVGVGRAAALGILFRSGEAIERAGTVDTVVLDKTGTVTCGTPAVSCFEVAEGEDKNSLLASLAAVESFSEHPLAKAIVEEAKKQGLNCATASNFKASAGFGVSGTVGGKLYQIGNAEMLGVHGIENVFERRASVLASGANTVLYCLRAGKLAGIIGIADPVKPESRRAVEDFESMGCKVAMFTGDNRATASAVCARVGISEFTALMLPQDKAGQIEKMRGHGAKVAFVGDGINDAPALATADVGMAVGAGSDIAIESADIILMKNSLMDAVYAVRLSRAVMRNIRQNLFWAFFYNAAGIPLAAGAFYCVWGITLHPAFAAAAMSFSSLSVLSNALRLRWFSPAKTYSSKEKNIGAHDMEKLVKIEGMNCQHCAMAVEKALMSVEGVESAKVDLPSKSATVKISCRVSDEALQKAVEAVGFKMLK